MRLVDANLLLHAYHPSTDRHKAAKVWLEDALSSAAPFYLSWQTITAFIRISTSSRVFEAPFTTRESVAIVSEWLAVPSVTVLAPGERHWEIFAESGYALHSRLPHILWSADPPAAYVLDHL